MTSLTCHLLSIRSSVTRESFIATLKALPASQRPLWLGETHHWIHEPHLSTGALLGVGPNLTKWEYLMVGSKELPSAVESQVGRKWSITAHSPDGTPTLRSKTDMLLSRPQPKLPQGWTPDDHSGIVTSAAHSGVAMSLDETSRPMGAERSTQGITLTKFTLDWRHTGPVVMFNLLSFLPNQRSVYFEGYGAGFTQILEPLFGGSPIQFGLEVTEWSSRAQEVDQEGSWEDFALIWYPSLWHFSKMISSLEYATLDRQFKPSVRDNPLICCTEIDLESHTV
ncbi:hypothetical protein F5Y19DRAFT_490123 [Xylariaceae sp. FL1651]|nr:hypothetical protein F5Y19DRAFT_490123 [Xylariaceae sp. FL1651]